MMPLEAEEHYLYPDHCSEVFFKIVSFESDCVNCQNKWDMVF